MLQNQPSVAPSRKLTVAVIAGGVALGITNLAAQASGLMFSFGWFAEQGIVFSLAFLNAPLVKEGITLGTAAVFGYMFRERTPS